MRRHTHLALLCTVIVIGLLISPVMAVEAAQGEDIYRPFNKAQECPDIDGNLIVWEDDRYDELERGVKDIYLATVEDIRSTLYGYSFGTRITDDPASQEKPSISGDYIVWQDNRHGNWDIYLYQRSTGEETRLTTDTGKQWLPIVRGNYIAWYDSSSGDTNIVLYDIAARATKDVIDCDAKTTIPYGSTEFKPALSENYVAWVEEADWKVHYYDIAAGRIIGPVSPGTAIQSWPSLSGSLIAWEDDRHGNSDIYMTDLDGPSGGEKRITSDTRDQVSAAISRTLIAWEDKRVPARSIYMYDLSPPGEELSVVDASDVYDEHLYPAVSGNTIVWQRGRGDDSNLYIFVYESGEPTEPVLTTVEVTPPTPTLAIDGTEQFTATAFDQNSFEMTGVEFDWTCSNTTVGTIDGSSGFFTAHAAGTATVTATAEGVSGTATVTVNAEEPVLDRIEVEPDGITLATDETRQFAATALDQFGAEMTGVAVAWSCSNTTVGTIDDAGLFTALTAGTTTVTASADGVSGEATVTVTDEEPVIDRITVAPTATTLEIGGTEQFVATVRDQFGGEMSEIPVAWASDNETVGTIDVSSGLFTAKAAGTANVTASADGVSGEATVTVTDEELIATSITIDPPTATLDVNGTVTFEAIVFDQFDGEMSGVTVTWACDNETVGTIGESSGIFTALAAGTATVTATGDGAEGTATVTVTAEAPVEPELTSITVTPTTATLEIDGTEQFAATAFDESGNEISGVEFDWSCSNTTVGTIGDTGLFTAHAAGTANVTATADGVSGTATVNVNADESGDPGEPVLTSITLTPPRATMDVDDIQRFMVTAYDQDGNVVPAGEIDWTCNSGTVGTIDGDGFFTAKAAGTATVTASAGGVAGTADVTVNEWPALAKIAVLPSAATLDVGDTLEFYIVAFDRFGNIVEDAEIAWECSNENVGTIDESSGLFTAKAAGTATVTATAEGVSGTATVTVNSDDPVLTSIAVTPSAITLARGDTATFTVLDQDGCEMPGVVIDWECSDSCVGTIDRCSGSFSALDCGTATVTATADGVTASADVEVIGCSGVGISPSAIILDPGDEWRFTVYGLQDNAGSTVAWSPCGDPGVGTITDSGLFTAVCGGTTSVTATIDGADEVGPATVTVRSASSELARIVVSPSDFRIPAGHSLTLTAKGFDQDGLPMDVDVAWVSSDETVGTIDDEGFFTALAEGDVILTASADGVSGSACVTVEPSLPVPACIEVTPATATLAPGGTREFTATVFDQCDNVLEWVRVAWSCSDADVGTIDRAGLFAAFAEGSADVTACAGGVEGTAAVTITTDPTPDPTAEPTPTPTNPGNSGGSADGGGWSPPTFFAGICENLKGGETHTFSGITVSSVGSVAITAADNIPKLLMIVKETKLPNQTEPPGGSIYEYVEIALSWVNQGDIGGATVTFTVPARWLEEHGILPEDVRLMRYVDGGWQILETEVIGEEDGKYRFRATTPGFSTFAIAAMPENMTVTTETDATAGETDVTVTATEEATTEPTTAVPTTTPAAPLVYAPFLAPLAFLLWRSRKN